MKKLFILLLFATPCKAHAQISQHFADIFSDKQLLQDGLNNVKKLAKKIGSLDTLSFYNIYWVKYKRNFKKVDFYNGTFVDSLKAIIISKKNILKTIKYYAGETLITNKSNKLIGNVFRQQLYLNNESNASDIKLVNLLYTKQLDYIFHIGDTNVQYMVGLKGNDAFIVDVFSDKSQIIPIQNFVDCYWTKYVMPPIK
jgi:hypothetical protein